MKRMTVFSLIFCIILSFVPASFAENITTDALVGYWNFDNETIDDVQSEVNPDGWEAIDIGTAVTAGNQGIIGNSFRLNKRSARGNDDTYINLGTVPEEIKNSKELTISVWINTPLWNWYTTVFSFANHTGDTPPIMVDIENGVMKGYSNRSDNSFAYSVEMNRWYFVTFTVGGNNVHEINAYVDGVHAGGRTIAGRNIDFDLYDLFLGAAPTLANGGAINYESFNGYIDEVKVFDKKLSDDEVAGLYDSYKVKAAAEDNSIRMYLENTLSEDNYIDVSLNGTEFKDNPEISGFAAEGLPDGLIISSVELIDGDTARIYFSGTSASPVTEDVSFSLTIKAHAVKNCAMDSDAITCNLFKPSVFVIEAEVTENTSSFNLSGKVIKAMSGIDNAVVLIGVYDGAMLMENIITEIEIQSVNDFVDISREIDITGYGSPSVDVYIWDKLPGSDSEGILSGGKILANSFIYQKSDIISGTTQNPELTVDVNSEEESVTVSGILSAKEAAVMVYSSDSVDHFKEVSLGESGELYYKYILNNPVEDLPYYVYVCDETGVKQKQFKFYSVDYRLQKLNEAKEKTGDEFSDFITAQQFVLDVDLSEESIYAALSEQAKTDFWTELLKGIASCENNDEFKTLFSRIAQEMTIVDKVNNAETAEALISVIEAEKTVLGFDFNDDYEIYKNKTGEAILPVVYHNISELKAGFWDKFYITIFNSIDYTDRTAMLEKLTKYKTELEIPEKFFGTKKNTYVKYMMGKTYTSKADIKAKAEEAIVWGDSLGSTGSGSGGSSGSSGGSSGGGKPGSSKPVSVSVTGVTDIKEPIISAEKANASFDDIDDVSWAKTAIEELAAKNIISGKASKIFAPNDFVTRAEFAKMIVLAFGEYNENLSTDSFSDVTADDWFCSYIANAADRKVILGREDGTFGANDFVTREDVCVMIYRQLQELGKRFNDGDADFDDKEKISEYAREGVNVLKAAGVINGVDENNFAPADKCTRAMAAQIIYNALNIEE